MASHPVTWFVCRSLGRSVVTALREAGEADVRHHDDHFAPDAADAEWLPKVAEHGWVTLSKDKRIRRRAPSVTRSSRWAGARSSSRAAT